MHNLPIFVLVFLFFALATRVKYGRLRSTFLTKIRYALTPIEDQWTLESLDGEVYEEVEIEWAESGEVAFKHRVGKARLPIALLTEASQKKLHDGLQQPSQVKVPSPQEKFVVASSSEASDSRKAAAGKVTFQTP